MLQRQQKIAFIGGGNMSTAILSGLIKQGHPVENIMVCAPTVKTRQRIEHEYAVQVEHDNSRAVDFADIILLAVKPDKIPDVCIEIGQAQQRTGKYNLMLSVAAGIDYSRLCQLLGHQRVICAMPNIPSAIGKGVTGLFASQQQPTADKNLADSIMAAVGTTIWVDSQEQMPAIVAAAGSAPAYFFLMLEAMEQAAMNMGLSKQQAQAAVIETGVGAMALAQQSELSFAELRRQVTSPNGTTAEGIATFQTGGLETLVAKAMENVANRSRAISAEHARV